MKIELKLHDWGPSEKSTWRIEVNGELFPDQENSYLHLDKAEDIVNIVMSAERLMKEDHE